MKKLLIASTALVSTAGFAFADGHTGVKLSGSAEMGIASVDDGTSGSGDAAFHIDMDVSFTLAGETDGGLSFGAKIDLDEVSSGIPSGGDKAAVYIKGDFGSVTMGDTDGALDWALTETAMGTAIADDHTSHAGYSGNGFNDGGGAVLRYDNTFGDFGVAVSYSMGADASTTTGTISSLTSCSTSGPSYASGCNVNVYTTSSTTAATDDAIAIGVKYTADLGAASLALGLGYTDAGSDNNGFGISAKTSISGVSIVLNYSDIADTTHTGIGIGYTMDALTLHANWGQFDDGSDKTDGYGLAVNYDLGGGAVVALGYGSDDSADRYSLGQIGRASCRERV